MSVQLCCCGCQTPTKPGRYFYKGHNSYFMHPVLKERFEAGFTKGEPDECWIWKGSTNQYGYGVLGNVGTQARAHRLAYEYAKGPIPDGQIVRHTCDNPPCCNPNHLLIGTTLDNSRDKVERKRHPHGERAYQAVLTDEAVRDIRRQFAAGVRTGILAKKYGVTVATASKAAYRQTWKHVEDAA